MPLARLVLFAVSVTLLAAPLEAQRPLSRSGLTIAFGLGGGSRGLRCDGCEVAREGGAASHLFVGGTLNPRLTVGGEINGWGKAEGGVEQSVASLMAVARLYPVVDRGFHLTGGLGMTSMSVERDAERLKTEGFGVEIGAGYDLRVASGFSLTPYAQLVRGFGGDGELDGVDIGEANPDYWQLGIAFTWH
jgi:biotin operon repressor